MSDSVEMISCLRHRDNTRYFIYYEDLQEISSEHPDKLAAFIRVLEVKTNKRIVSYASLLEDAIRNGAPIPPLNLWLEVSYNDFVYWSLGTLGRSSFQTADKVAQKKLLVRSRVLMRPIRPDDPDSPKVPYKEYILVRENAQAAIDKQEVPIHGEDYEKYGDTPPVIENIPLLKKTVGMLTETRGGMLEKTGPRVEKNRLINKDKDNTTKESKKSNMSSSDDAPSHQSEKEKYEKRIAELEDKIACFLQASKDGNYPPVPPRGGAFPPTAGSITVLDGGNHSDATDTMVPDHNVILEPPCNATMPLTQDSAIIPQSENTPSESLPQTQEMPSSTQAVDESNRQATEQGASNVSSSLIPVDTYPRNIGGLLHHSEIGGQQNQESISLLPDVGASNSASMVCDIPNTQLKQASGDDPIAGVTTNIFTELPFKDRPVEVKRNGRKVNPVNERVKWFYDVFTALGAEFFEDDTFKADYVYSKNDPMYKLIITYVSEGVSPYEMRMAFEHMWNEERDGQYFWQNPDTLTNRAFCKHLRSKISSAKFKIKQAERRASSNGSKNTPRASTAGSQYIVDELEEAALASIAAMEG